MAKIITKMPLKFCTMLGGMFHPNMVLSVWLFAIKVNDEPACSKAPQKNITKKHTIYKTQTGRISAVWISGTAPAKATSM